MTEAETLLRSLEEIVAKNITCDKAEESLILLEFVLTMRTGLFPPTLSKSQIADLWETQIRNKSLVSSFLLKTTSEFRFINELVDERWLSFCKQLTSAFAIDGGGEKSTDMYSAGNRGECLIDNVLKTQVQSREQTVSYLTGNPWLCTLLLFTMLPPNIKPLRKYSPEKE